MIKSRMAQISASAAQAIASNGFAILKQPKYASQIKRTVIHKLSSNGPIVHIWWLDGNDQIVSDSIGELKWYPIIGEQIEDEVSE